MLDLSAAFDTVSHAGGRGRPYCFPVTFIDPFRLPVGRHIAQVSASRRFCRLAWDAIEERTTEVKKDKTLG